MNSLITTLPPPPAAPSTTTILTKSGFSCSLITLAPGAELPASGAPATDEQILFVIEGEAAVQLGDDVTTMLGRESALLIPSGREPGIVANSGSWTKLLRVQVPARTQLVSPLVTMN